MKPALIVCIGPGGTGKTTFCRTLVESNLIKNATFYQSKTREWYNQYCSDPQFTAKRTISADKEGFDPIFQDYLKRCYIEEFSQIGRKHQNLSDKYILMDRSPFCRMAYAQYGTLRTLNPGKITIAELEIGLSIADNTNMIFLGQWLGIVQAYFNEVYLVNFSFFASSSNAEIMHSYKSIAAKAEDGFRDTSPHKNAKLDGFMQMNIETLDNYLLKTRISLNQIMQTFTPHEMTPENQVGHFVKSCIQNSTSTKN